MFIFVTFYNKNIKKILIILLIIYLVFRFAQINTSAAEAGGFLPGGAWELDMGKEIWVDDIFPEIKEDNHLARPKTSTFFVHAPHVHLFFS